jgi:hypothetical protein
VTAEPVRVRLVDAPEEAGRTTATLLASLAARLGTLFLVSGADAVGSLVAGFCALGREVGLTAEGAQLRRAIDSGRAGANGEAIWRTLNLDRWISTVPPSPVLDQLRNDLALLLAEDLIETLELMPIPGEAAGDRAPALADWNFSDLVLGLWAFSSELAGAVDALAEPTLPEPGEVRTGDMEDEPPAGELLR